MIVLSLFDGISCGKVAFERAGIKIDKYYASEIDPYAIKVSKKNHPDIIHLGDVTKWREWDIPWEKIDILIGGSPCQGFSVAGKRLNFEDPRSKLFFEYVDILNHIKKLNPNVKFLLENVKMKKEWQDIISSYLGVEPIEINSALVSAQQRKRLYWTNIEGVSQPEDRGILLKDILESGIGWQDKAYCLPAVYYKGATLRDTLERHRRSMIAEIVPPGYKKSVYNVSRGKITINDKIYPIKLPDGVYIIRKLTPIECERLQTLPDDYTAGISDTRRYICLGNAWTVDVIAHIFKGLKGMVKMARLEEIDKDLDENGVVLAKDIDDCSNCPLYESECHGLTSNGAGNPIEPPCTSWNDDDEIWGGMLELQRLEWEEYEERQKKRERSMKAKKAAETRKRYAHLDDKYAKFKEWLPKSQWRLIITSRRLNRVYMRAIGKISANYYFDLQKEKFHIVRGNVSLLDKNTMNRFENDFKEMFYGVRPKDRDFVKEIQNKIAEKLKEFEVF